MAPTLIAHRGYPQLFPENTLVGYRAAVAAGAKWLETDIQFSRDGEPMLYHDRDLRRTSNQPGQLADYSADQLARWDAAERDRFGEKYVGEPIPRLQDFVRWLEPLESVHVMIELKPETLDSYGADLVVRRVLRGLDSIIDRCVVISKDLAAVDRARSMTEIRTGWVLPVWDESNRELAEDHVPDFMIVDHKCVPHGRHSLWQGTWHWVVYSIDDPDVAYQQFHRGIEFVETDAIGALMADRRFRQVDHHGTL